jgi:hypothetical protein
MHTQVVRACASYVDACMLVQYFLLHIQIPTHACAYVVGVCVRALHDVDMRVPVVFALSHPYIYMNTHTEIVCACVNKVDVCVLVHTHTYIHIYRFPHMHAHTQTLYVHV